jgi:hypothetical protein
MSWLSCEPRAAFEVFILCGLECFIMQLMSSVISFACSVGKCCVAIYEYLPLMASLIVDLGLGM